MCIRNYAKENRNGMFWFVMKQAEKIFRMNMFDFYVAYSKARSQWNTSALLEKILRALSANGSPKPEFETDDDHSYFISRFFVHEAFLEDENERSLSEEKEKELKDLEKEPKKSRKGAKKEPKQNRKY